MESFSEIDEQIARERWNYPRHDNAGKTDRYGKKYSWIAFYEMAGHRSDLGMLKDWDDEDEFRISDVDIDPSFPVELKKIDLFKALGDDNFLGNASKSTESWYDTDSDLNTSKYIHIKNKFEGDKEHEWILLKGIVAQKDKVDQTRDIHIAINTLLVSEENYEKIKEVLKKHSDYTFGYIRAIDHYYLFEGEIPWCNLMPNDYSENLRIRYNYRNVGITKKELKILNGSRELTKEELAKLKEKENDVIEIEVERTTFESSWESYHSDIIPVRAGGTITPSKSICEKLGLFIKSQSSDLYNENGDLITTSIKYGEGYDQTSTFTYIRKEYLEKYLKDSNKKAIWFQWAEKRYFSDGVKKLSFGNEKSKTEYRKYFRIIL
ncbi:MAG: hypothetical protein KAU01_12085 [Candidatus Cloacimonetes bacterium]|nr:hypothetical protein [Candidatus Cloacimonadota bacterium]